ncbi:MAG: clan AA aspartic protease [Beijerinckiaceae bacterium]|nr:clan AA aspartic protease [Beijerinckiaceae bacterium]
MSYAELTIANASRPDLLPLTVRALADTGALHLCIPEHVALQLQLAELEKREVTLADGSKRALPYVGPIHLRFGNRSGFMGAMVLGDEVLLGAVPMEDLDLIVHPAPSAVAVNPLNPNLPASVAKGLHGPARSSKRT